MEHSHHEKVAILDAGAQYGKVIDRRVRELKVCSEIVALDTSVEKLRAAGYKALIISGGPGSVYAADAPTYDPGIFKMGLPVLGICYGLHMLNRHFGGKVGKGSVREDGQFTIKCNMQSKIFKGLNEHEEVLLTHGDSCEEAGSSLQVIATSGNLIAAVANEEQALYGVQFHPEVDLSVHGKEIMHNFLFEVAGLKGDFTMGDRSQECIDYIKHVVGDKKVLMLLSGGVDSTVCAALLARALQPSQLYAIHIDNGFMRKNESADVVKALEELNVRVQLVSAAHRFLSGRTRQRVKRATSQTNPEDATAVVWEEIGPLQERVTNPEEKRRIIGDVFMQVAEEVVRDLKLQPEDVFLGQGTLRPDLIESASELASTKADAIKTHHNDTEMVRALRKAGRVVEPLKDFHKDEVRQLGTQLGLPEKIVQRHPFPGPGLAIRCLCASEPYRCSDYQHCAALVAFVANFCHARENPANENLLAFVMKTTSDEERERLAEATKSYEIRAQILPIRTVGVQGDARSYSYACAFSTAEAPHWSNLLFLAKLLPRICHKVNRLVYVFGPPVAHAVEDITPTFLRPPVLDLLREVDVRANHVLARHPEVQRRISQMPVVLIPVHFDRETAAPNPLAAPAEDEVGNVSTTSTSDLSSTEASDSTAHSTTEKATKEVGDLSAMSATTGLLRPKFPSVLRSVVLRPFITNDFMTGLPAVPDVDIPLPVLLEMVRAVSSVAGVSRVLYDLTGKPPGTTEWE